MLYRRGGVFVEGAFRHGYSEEDFFEVLETGPLRLRSRRGLAGVYELLGRTHAGAYLHIAFRREVESDVVFHMRAMTTSERKLFRR